MAKTKVVPAKLDLEFVRGDTIARSIEFQENDVPLDVSTNTYTSQVRRSTEAAVAATFTVDMADAATGVIVLRMADTVTDDLDGSYVWDLQQETAGGVFRTMAGGTVFIRRDVTRAV